MYGIPNLITWFKKLEDSNLNNPCSQSLTFNWYSLIGKLSYCLYMIKFGESLIILCFDDNCYSFAFRPSSYLCTKATMFHKSILFSFWGENMSHSAYCVVHFHARTAIRPTRTFSYFFTRWWKQKTFLKCLELYIINQDDEWSPNK